MTYIALPLLVHTMIIDLLGVHGILLKLETSVRHHPNMDIAGLEITDLMFTGNVPQIRRNMLHLCNGRVQRIEQFRVPVTLHTT
jgi:hypothetical protein